MLLLILNYSQTTEMSAPELTVFPMVPGGLAPFRPAMADVQQITDQVGRSGVNKL